MVSWLISGGAATVFVAALGVVAVLLFVSRLVSLRRAQVAYEDMLQGVENVVRQGNFDEALAICDETNAPVARVVAAALRHRGGSARALREAVDVAGRTEVSRIGRRFAAVAVIAQISPMLGLVGTFAGLAKALLAMDAGVVVVRGDLMSAAAQAISSAIAGLLVAVVAHVAYAVLRSRLDRLVVELEAAASEIIALLSERREVA